MEQAAISAATELAKEEAVFERLLKKAKLAEGNPTGILVLDRELAERDQHEDPDL